MNRQMMGSYGGPAQQRYGGYFGRVLHDQRLSHQPSVLTQQLHQVVFSSLKGLNLQAAEAANSAIDASVNMSFFDEDPRPFLVVFQHGRKLFSGFAEVVVSGGLAVQPLRR